MAPTGEALGRAEGLVIFVPYGLPGEKVEIEIVHQRRNFARAHLLRVIEPVAARVTPPCPHVGRCGGCQWQHIDYAAQVQFKTEIVREQLTRMGKFSQPPVQPCLPCPKPFGYRNNIQLVMSPRGRLGYRAAQSHYVVEIDRCPIADESMNEWLAKARPANPQRLHPNAAAHEVDLRIGVQTGERSFDTRQTIHERVGEWTFQVSPEAFFQVNTAMAEVLVQQVLAYAKLKPSDRVLDLYSGVGLFTAPLAAQAQQVVGIEASPIAVRDAQHNLASLANVRIIEADVALALGRSSVKQQAWDVVVLDPPRAGVERPALELMAALQAPRIVYVSCDPATLARDARYLCDHGYVLRAAQPLDMFPQTYHVETIAYFELSPSG